MKHLIIITASSTLALGACTLPQQQSETQPSDVAALNAERSDPVAMGWMQGFPPPRDKVIRLTDTDYFSFPKLRWTVSNFRQLMPTVGVSRGASEASQLPSALDPAIGALTFTPLEGSSSITWDEAFDLNYTDGLLVIHQGRIVYERYAGSLDSTTLHGAMSVTKSLTGLMGEALVAEGRLNEADHVGDLIPELRGSAFADATVKQVLEMTTALNYSEDYSDPNAEVWSFAQAGSTLPPPAGYSGPRSYFEFLATIKKRGEHGSAFGYKTVNADVLGWLIARATERSLSDHFAETVWSKIGAEREAFYTVDSIGTPFAGGGFNATLRDLGRLGLLVLNEGRWRDEQVVPKAAIARIRQGGNPNKFAKAGYSTLEGWSYRGMWWISHDSHGSFAARGVHGQTIWINPMAQMVIVRFASNPVAANAANDPISLPAYRALADYLLELDLEPSLIGSKWAIEEIAGRAVAVDSTAHLQFLQDGRLAGNASVNRLLGNFSQDGNRVSFEAVGTTLMAGPEALMDQERRLLELLPQVSTFELDAKTLTLKTKQGATIVARRQ